jgi:hypothetical protein
MRILLLGPTLVSAQVLFVGRTLSPEGKLLGIDTIFRFEKAPAYLHIQYRVPAGYERDTFLLLVRNALGPLAWIGLPPTGALRQARLQLSKSGVYGLFIYAKGRGNRIWAFKRIYVILPPHQNLAQVKAYHNALLSQRHSPTAPTTLPPEAPPLPEPPDDPLQKTLPTSEILSTPISPDEIPLPDDIQLSPLEEMTSPSLIEEEDLLEDDP